MTDETPPCTLQSFVTGPSTCYCTGRPGCKFVGGDWGDEDDEDWGEEYWDAPPRRVETIDTGGLT